MPNEVTACERRNSADNLRLTNENSPDVVSGDSRLRSSQSIVRIRLGIRRCIRQGRGFIRLRVSSSTRSISGSSIADCVSPTDYEQIQTNQYGNDKKDGCTSQLNCRPCLCCAIVFHFVITTRFLAIVWNAFSISLLSVICLYCDCPEGPPLAAFVMLVSKSVCLACKLGSSANPIE
jgi:hypothetical protein